eukprot:gene20177-22152_t
MEHNESIYEEIMTSGSELGRERRNENDARGYSFVGSDKDQTIQTTTSLNNSLQENDDSLYAVVNGEDLEFKKLKELLNDADVLSKTKEDVDGNKGNDIAQHATSNEENDSGCDCSNQIGKELLHDETNQTQRPNSLKLNKINETVYSEILHLNPAAQIDVRPGRLTRESNNPILRQEVVSKSNSASPSTSKAPSRNSSFNRLHHHGDSTRSGSGDSGIQEDFPTVVYGNCTSRPVSRQGSRSLSRQSSHNHKVYENASPVTTPETSTSNTVYSNLDDEKDTKSENASSGNVNKQDIYENLEDEVPRPRAASQPITIQRKRSNVEKELLYSDLDFKEEIPESLSSSPGDGSSTSSWLSLSSNAFSISPPPLPHRPASVCSTRPRQPSFSSVSMSSYGASNGLKALYIGSQTVNKATLECMNSAIIDVAHKNTMLDIKSVIIDINKNIVNLGKLSPPYDCILQFSIDDIHYLERCSKEEKFLGIIVSKPRKEAVCYVLQSDQSAEIIEVIRDCFKDNAKRSRLNSPERTKSLYGVPEIGEQNSFSGLIKIGSLKVKKTYLVINESIGALLEKTNPKEYKKVNISVQQSSIEVSNPISAEIEDEHSVPWVLSLGLYNKDDRYFAFTVTRTKNAKRRVFCHVFRASRAFMAALVLESIRRACQSTLLATSQSTPRISHSMPRDGFYSHKPKHLPSDVISRSSNSSGEETVTPVYSNSTPSSTRGSPVSPQKQGLHNLSQEDKAISQVEINTTSNDFVVNDITSTNNDNNDQPDHVVHKDDHATHEQDHATHKQDNATHKQDHATSKQDHATSKQDHATHKQDHATSKQDHATSKQDHATSKQDHATSKQDHATSKQRRSTLFKGKLFRGTINRKKTPPSEKASITTNQSSLNQNEADHVLTPIEPQESKFVVSYLCSAFVNPPLKPKHVEKCVKQFHKEMGKKRKDVNPVGNVLVLEISSDKGVTMIDMKNPGARQFFPIATIDSFIMHPDDSNCFAFSTTVSADQQRKYHVFSKAREDVSLVKEAFDLLKKSQTLVGI